ncbi:hypothetical protein CCR75_003413 [Bremia lactucae]|uniref:N-acetylgalactosaminide beta-1,3-galactosyltransferase n=1 Tax=Bremia lactucae TaxID=4779 RepID=A0A976IHM0_BRELC|nr:hypothetical protein CCR75_003413 [Bremia lactucae]
MALAVLFTLVIAGCTLATVLSAEALLSKAALCEVDVDKSRPVINMLQVSEEPANQYPRVLCFAVTYSSQHHTRVQAVAETWGQRCDKLLFFSNMSDTIIVGANTSRERHFDIVHFDIIADHKHLWLRTRAALKYLYDHFRHEFDWFYKCDDDTYVIVENLRSYLKRPEILQRVNRAPMQIGHRFSMPTQVLDYYIKNSTLRAEWHIHWDRMIYNSGGSGYVMNRLYLDTFVKSLPETTCLSDTASSTMPEDAAVAFCMIWNDVYPWDTRDHHGRDRWHALNPRLISRTWRNRNDWYERYHIGLGGLRSSNECAAPDSVAFHYVKPVLMYHLERSLYFCRSKYNDIAAFNEHNGLAIGDKVMVMSLRALVIYFHLSTLVVVVISNLETLSSPATILSKAELCALDVDRSRIALNLIHVTPQPSSALRPNHSKIFCIVNTISVHHQTRAQAVAETWGQRCDKLMFFSNVTDTIVVAAGTSRAKQYPVVKMDVIADHHHLWQKHKATLRYVYAHYRHEFDWFYKADDDAYVIVENLRQYLRRPEIYQTAPREAMQMGHRFNLTQELVSYYIVDDTIEKRWRDKWNRWVFNSGGPGYVMNRLYLDKIVSILPDGTCMSDKYSEMVPDDVSISFCMMWHNVFPWDTRDHQGRERWHADSPKGVFMVNPNRPNYWYVQYHQHIGGVRPKEESVAPDTVAFHYIQPHLMYHIERTLYWCREGDEVTNVSAFNDKYGLAIGDKIMVH